MTTFQIRKDEEGNDLLFKIEENGKEWSVPMVEDNSDYQRYLAWLEDPNAETTPPIL